MHDTMFTPEICVDSVCENNFDPHKVQSDSDFIADYRRQLNMLNLRVASDYGEIKERYRSQARRLDALEGLVPSIHMQHVQLQSLSRELRALKRVVTDLQCFVQEKQPTFLDRLLMKLTNVLQVRI